MEDIMGKIGELLSDEESVKQISEIAQMLMSETSGGDSETNTEESCTENNDDNSEGENESPFGSFDFSSLMKLQGLMGAFGKSDKNTELLLALKPHLKEEKQEKVEKAIKLLRLLAVWNVVKESGMLKDFL